MQTIKFGRYFRLATYLSIILIVSGTVKGMIGRMRGAISLLSPLIILHLSIELLLIQLLLN